MTYLREEKRKKERITPIIVVSSVGSVSGSGLLGVSFIRPYVRSGCVLFVVFSVFVLFLCVIPMQASGESASRRGSGGETTDD